MSQRQQLKAGLEALGRSFNAEICQVCKGEGQYEQHYTVGCGMGSCEMMGKCDYCYGTGLIQYKSPAPQSVVNQVLQAGATAKESLQVQQEGK